MVENTYKKADGVIKTGAVQYNVQPNLTVSRGFQNLETAIQKGMQLKQQINESDFQKRQTDLRNTMSVFKENYEKASWKERQMMAKELEDMKTGSTGKDNKWDRELERMGIEFSSAVNINLEREREQRRKAAAAAAKAAANRRKALKDKIETLELYQNITDADTVEGQRELLETFGAEHVTPYKDAEDVEGMAKYADGLQTFNSLNSKISTAEENALNQRLELGLDTAVAELTENLDAATTVAEKQQLVNNYRAEHVDQYEDSTDLDGQALWVKGMGNYNRLNSVVTQERRGQADAALGQEAALALSTKISVNGIVTPEELKDIVDTYIVPRSDYESRGPELRQSVFDAAIDFMIAENNNPDITVTDDRVKKFNAQLDNFVKADPYVKGSPQFRRAQDFVSAMQSTVNRRKEIDVSAALANEAVSFNVFEGMSENLFVKGIISEEVHKNNLTSKKAAIKDSTHRQLILPYIQNSDAEGLADLLDKNSDMRLGTVQDAVKEALELRYAHLTKANPDDEGGVNAHILQEMAKYEEQGLAPTSIDAIDQALKGPRSGEQLTNQQLEVFMKTYEAVLETGYFVKNGTDRRKAAADYERIKEMIDFGVPDIGATLHNARQNKVSVKQVDIDNTIMEAIGANPAFTENLAPENSRLLLTSLRPVVRLMMEGGYESDSTGSFLERGIAVDYFRVDPLIGAGTDVLIPRSEHVPTAKSYKRGFDTIASEMKSEGFSLGYLGPSSGTDPDSDWYAISKDGAKRYVIPAKDMGIISRTGRLPN